MTINSQPVGILANNRPLLRFIGVFAGIFVLLQILYGSYLAAYDNRADLNDPFTHLLARQVAYCLQLFDAQAQVVWRGRDNGYWIELHGHAVARIIEGCNAMRIMALFVAFVAAFYRGWRSTLGFMAAGVMGIHLFNLLRISALSLAIAAWPQSAHALHEYVFPMLLYGFVMLLWVYWVQRFFPRSS